MVKVMCDLILLTNFVLSMFLDGRDSRTDGDSLSTQGSHTMISGRSIEVNCFGSMSYGGTKRSESNASRRSL